MGIEAPSAEEFCRIIGAKKLDGSWSGSAFRHHPKGIFRERMLFTNEWNVNHYCSVKVATDPDATLVLGCQDPAAHGNPNPKMSSGDLVTVYQNGRWVSDGPWCEKIVRVLDDVQREIREMVEAERKEYEARQEASKIEAQARLAAAAAAVSAI